MTVIVAIRSDDVVWMCADSRLTTGSSITGQIQKVVTHKVLAWQPSEPMTEVLIAVSGRAAAISIARHSLTIGTAPRDPDDDDAWNGWAYNIACRLAALAVDAKPSLTHEGMLDWQGLLACGKRLWALEDQHIMPVESWHAIGSGGPAARGALHTLMQFAPDTAPDARAVWAVKTAIEHDAACGGEIWLHCTEVNAVTCTDRGGEPLPAPI